LGTYQRTIQPAIEANLYKGKAIIIYGARQVGKTTLCRAIMRNYPTAALYLNCDEPDIRQALTHKTSTELRGMLGAKKLIVIDEAQRVKDIGLTLKLLIDTYPEIQIIATGSSSFDLSNETKEPLTGRKIEYYLYPLAVSELLEQESRLETVRLLETRLRFGSYPGVINSDDPAATIAEIAGSYLYRDILEVQTVKNPDQLHRLLQALALQVGKEVSYTELGTLLGLDKATIARYVTLLEHAYVIFHLPPFSRNLRKELGKQRKIYFYDVGVRNALINNFNPLHLRQDIGALWENYFIIERMKYNQNRRHRVNPYFWRTYDGQEIDYLEEAGGQLTAFECKWSKTEQRIPPAFAKTYPGSTFQVVHSQNYLGFLLDPPPSQIAPAITPK
jgi:predicted AAA+ superfamily ATPase